MRFLVNFSIYGLFVYGKKVLSKICYIFFANSSLAMLQSISFIFHVKNGLIFYTQNTDMLNLNLNEKNTCENCGTQTTEGNTVRHKTRFSAGTLYCTKNPNFSTTSQVDLKDHLAENNPRVRVKTTDKCEKCLEEFSGFYALGKHRSSQHGIPIMTSSFDMDTLLEDIDDVDIKEALNSCNHFLVDLVEKGRNCVFNSGMSSFNNSFLNEILHHVFNQLKQAANISLAFGFVLKNIEDGKCRYFYAQENKTVMERSKLVCTQDDFVNLERKLWSMDTVDHYTRKRANIKWGFYKLTNVTVFASLLKDIPMGYKDNVLPDPLLKIHNVNCLTF